MIDDDLLTNEKNREQSAFPNKNIPYADDIVSFEKLTCENAAKLISAGQKCPFLLSCYSPGCLIMWRDYFNPSFALVAGCVLIKVSIKNKELFLFPYEYEESADLDAALHAIERYVAKGAVPYSFLSVQRDVLPHIAARYKSFSVVSNRNQSDYIYLSTDMQTFSGRKYSGQRNHINKFTTLYPNAVFRELGESEEDKAKLRGFWERYEAAFTNTKKSALAELENAKAIMSRPCISTSHKACIEIDGKLIAVCFGEVFSDMLIIHVEKALDSYRGVYPFMVTAFAKAYGGNVKYINREDDAGSRGLRISKTQYNPLRIEENITVKIATELNSLKTIPSITTERLQIDAITEQDIAPYNRLSLDVEHNKYWGYDYRSHLDGEPPVDYFYKAVIGDIKNKTGLSLAVRHEGVFVGEAVINEFDFKGGANVGIRILPEFTGKGFGKEAFCAVCDFGLYGLGLSSVSAYCFKLNQPSYRMLASCMKLHNEDEKYYYFIKKV